MADEQPKEGDAVVLTCNNPPFEGVLLGYIEATDSGTPGVLVRLRGRTCVRILTELEPLWKADSGDLVDGVWYAEIEI